MLTKDMSKHEGSFHLNYIIEDISKYFFMQSIKMNSF